jgi:hypothetical protein
MEYQPLADAEANHTHSNQSIITCKFEDCILPPTNINKRKYSRDLLPDEWNQLSDKYRILLNDFCDKYKYDRCLVSTYCGI